MTGSVALTFDDGPDPVWTPRILDALDEAGARATFFVVAPLAREHPALVRGMLDGGHEIGLHCARHVRHDRMLATEILADATEGLGDLDEFGHLVRDWRTPWGVVTGDTEGVARRLGLRLVGWTVDSADWRGITARAMLDLMAPEIDDHSIVLMHDAVGAGAPRTDCRQTVDLVPSLIDLSRSRGLEPVPAGKLRDPVPDRNPDKVSGV